MTETKKTPSGKKGPCTNCGHIRFIASKAGHCTTCNTAVKGISVHDPAYITALAEVKTRLTDPNQKRMDKKTGTSRSLRTKAKTGIKQKSSLDYTIKEVALTGIPGIIQKMRDERAGYLSEAEKLGKAINLLESL